MRKASKIMLIVVISFLIYGCSVVTVQLLKDSCYNSEKLHGVAIDCEDK
jgi:hypothetical protein